MSAGAPRVVMSVVIVVRMTIVRRGDNIAAAGGVLSGLWSYEVDVGDRWEMWSRRGSLILLRLHKRSRRCEEGRGTFGAFF